MEILWHRRDLRNVDNTALDKSDKCIPVYIFDPREMSEIGYRQLEFIRQNLMSLRESYRNYGSDLIVKHGNTEYILETLVEEHDADGVVCNQFYEPYNKTIYDSVDSTVENVERFYDKGINAPDEIYTNKGTPYQVFTYYHKKWKKRSHRGPSGTPAEDDLITFETETEIPETEDLGIRETNIDTPEPGYQAAREKLEAFASNRAGSYGDMRDYPAEYETSRLSAYLSLGIISSREVLAETEEDDFIEQLAWSDFYTQVLQHNPSVVDTNYKDYENSIEWTESEERLDAWKNGETGYPIVDAGMRQLKKEGYMHNRLRMIVASFLTKDLLIDWRKGYNWFKKMLFDHDTANNNGGWQWAASTGTDAQPYFRIFNPMTQGENYDENAEYIKSYVPELSNVSPEHIHSWNELTTLERKNICPDYPEPIVEHSKQREKALEMFEEARGD